ncbi:putative Developmental regulator protein [Seiridium unicorne]|uniref:Developmental regulator protein n=1 Tax=Seiridium unicorne TaxID=138068 RepID=A0ABR2V8A7_9PEZI
MPAYLCHGFRWHRKSVRYFVILQDVEDAAPEWIVAPKSAEAILESLYNLHDFIPACAQSRAATSLAPYDAQNSGPNADMYKVNIDSSSSSDEERRGRLGDDMFKNKRSVSAARQRSISTTRLRKPGKRPETLPVPPRPVQAPPPLYSPLPPESERNGPFNNWSTIKMLEEYDPSNELVMNGPWAYLSDYVVRIDTSVSPMEEMVRYEERMKAQKFKAMSGSSDETGRKVKTVGSKNAGWLEKLRDQLQQEEPIKWYVVMCGDEERSFPLGDDEDNVVGETKNGEPLEDEFQFRLPEFAGYGYDRRSAVVQPLRLRKQNGSPPPLPTPQIFQQFQPGGPTRNPSQSPAGPRPQTQPQPQLPPLRTPSVDKPPAVPDKDLSGYTPPLDPLANLRDVGSRKTPVQVDMKPSMRKSTIGLRKLFSKKQVENFL